MSCTLFSTLRSWLYLRRSMLSQVILHVGFQGLAMALPLLLLPVITRYLRPSEYGEYSLFSMLVVTIYPVLALGIDQLLANHYLHQSKAELSRFVSTYLALLIGLVALLVGTQMVMNGWLASASGLDKQLLYWLVALPCLNCLITLGQVVGMMERNTRLQGLLIVGRVVLAYAVSVPLIVFVGAGWSALLFGQIAAGTGLATLSLWYLQRKVEMRLCFDTTMARQIVTLGAPLIVFVMAISLTGLGERFLIRNLLDTAAVGVYAVCYTLMSGFMMGFIAISRVSTPWILEKRRDASAAAKQEVVVMTYLMLAAVAGVFAMVTLGSNLLVDLLIHGDYRPAPLLPPLLAVSMMCYTMFTMISGFLSYQERTGVMGALMVCAMALNLLLDVLLIPMLGLVGAALGSLLANATLLLLCAYAVKRLTPLPWGEGARLGWRKLSRVWMHAA